MKFAQEGCFDECRELKQLVYQPMSRGAAHSWKERSGPCGQVKIYFLVSANSGISVASGRLWQWIRLVCGICGALLAIVWQAKDMHIRKCSNNIYPDRFSGHLPGQMGCPARSSAVAKTRGPDLVWRSLPSTSFISAHTHARLVSAWLPG